MLQSITIADIRMSICIMLRVSAPVQVRALELLGERERPIPVRRHRLQYAYAYAFSLFVALVLVLQPTRLPVLIARTIID